VPARTDAAVLARSPTAALLRCEAATGRLHQVRVHLSAVGNPLIGDKIYGNDPSAMERLAAGTLTREEVLATGHVRHALHAWALSLPHPDGGTLTVTAPLALDLRSLLAAHGVDAPAEVSAQPSSLQGR
jgi:23S rRNA pseudouridine1911/1915/1917 synthase